MRSDATPQHPVTAEPPWNGDVQGDSHPRSVADHFEDVLVRETLERTMKQPARNPIRRIVAFVNESQCDRDAPECLLNPHHAAATNRRVVAKQSKPGPGA